MSSNRPETRADGEPRSAPERADIAVAQRLAKHRHHPAMRLAGAASELGDQLPLLTLSGAFLALGWWREHPPSMAAGGRMIGSVLVATAIKTVLKRLLSRTRPHVLFDEGYYNVRTLGPNEGGWQSFPSGHTAGSVAAAGALTREFSSAAIPAYAAAGAIALAQVPRGAHYPSDVAAGVLIGLAAEAVVERLGSAAARALRDRGSTKTLSKDGPPR